MCRGHNADGSAAAPVHVVIGNAGADLCFNVEPRQPRHFEVRLPFPTSDRDPAAMCRFSGVALARPWLCGTREDILQMGPALDRRWWS